MRATEVSPTMQRLWWVVVLVAVMLGGAAEGDGGSAKGGAISASNAAAVRSRGGSAPSAVAQPRHPIATPLPTTAPAPPSTPHPSTPPPAMADAPVPEENDVHLPLSEDDPPSPAGPLYFATGNSTRVTAQLGSTALVPCVVRNIGDGMVSWIRRRDYHLLTVGLTTYSSDERFSAVHAQHSEDWTLQIKYVQATDAGLYECQVSSHPPTSIFIDLRVVEARADILGPSEKYLKSGSMLRLSCVLRQSTEPPVFVFWYHNNRMINYDRDRGVNVTSPVVGNDVAGAEAGGSGSDGSEVAAEGGAASATAALGPDEEHASTLVIAAAQKAHSGNYSCVPNNAQPASTYVHILNGENPAAMQHGGRGLGWLRSPSAWILAACLVASLSPTCCRLGSQTRPSATDTVSPTTAEATPQGNHRPKSATALGRWRRRRLLQQQRQGRRWHRRRGRRRGEVVAATT
ncbi:uncharacterized protein LOC124165419 isoform X2 [Ischnura elegans]|uniref:uncharacterized protein LOC124165419 isoform X2 n=1 Tax=Ischnura elegans TaxID=197161 RepID=UPI001ED8B48A|nr:uncharacterized protein LOC124165419 isoform X2 [Ischnura elegans]